MAARRRPADGGSGSELAAVDSGQMARAQRALEERRLDDAMREVAGILAGRPDYLPALDIRRQALFRAGELTASLEVVRSMRRVEETPERADLDHLLVATLRESDPAWLPRLPGPPRPVEPARSDRILHLLKASLPDRQSGYTMRSHYVVTAQRAAGLEPVVLTPLGFPRSAGRVAPAMETLEGTRFHRLDLGVTYPATFPPDRYLEDFAWTASAVVEAERPAILHAASGYRGYELALVGLALRERHRIPLVYEVRGFFETTWSRDDAEEAELGRRRDAAETRVMSEADAVITIAEAMRDDIVARGIDPQKVFVAPNGVDATTFAPRPPSPALRARHGLHGFVFGYVSNMDHPREAQELLVDAAVRLRARGRDATCLLVGDGRRRRAVEEHARDLGAGDAVVFAGAVPHAEVPDYYATLDAFVVPRRDERAARLVTPLKPYEAMAMGRPIVVSDLPALREIAAPDDRGLAFPPDDVDALVACLERLIDDPGLGRALGEAGRGWVCRERSWAANVPRFETAYAFARERHAGSA